MDDRIRDQRDPLGNLRPTSGKAIEAFWAFDDYYEILEDARASRGGHTLLRAIFPSGSARMPPHYHKRTTVVVTVERGPVRIVVDGTDREYATGAVVTIPAGAVHRLAGSPTSMTSVLLSFEPGGIESALREFGHPHDMPRDPTGPSAAQKIERIIAEGEAYDVYVVQ